jgi:hypothetical protein
MLQRIKNLFNQLNAQGVPVPFIRDPKSNRASVSLTLTVISFNVVLIGLVGKWSSFLGGVDLTQALYWFGMCAGLYFGRSMVKRDNQLEVKGEKDDDTEKKS